MITNIKKNVVPFLLVICLVASVVLGIIYKLNTKSVEIDNTSLQDEIETYYKELGSLESLTSGKYSKDDVINALQALIGYSNSGEFKENHSDKYIKSFGKTIKGTDNKHPKYNGVGDRSLAYLWQYSERKENDVKPTGAFRLFYSDVYSNTLDDYKGGSPVNREHVWPQSLSGGLFGKTGGGSDIHHVRPANAKLNNVRGNKPFAEIPNEKIALTYYTTNEYSNNFNVFNKYIEREDLKKTYKGILTGYASKSYFEPIDEYKGDIARIFAYLITHYSELTNLLDKVIIGGKYTLVKWNSLDPVDLYEVNRNELGYKYQGNRNPFIDEPKLIDFIWGNSDYVTG